MKNRNYQQNIQKAALTFFPLNTRRGCSSGAEANLKLKPENLHFNSKRSVTVVQLTNGLLAALRTSDPRLPGNMSAFTAAGRATLLLFEA